ncbi:MAG: polysaccharide deacetylase family protein [Lachnospiraceae bacterium]
MKKIPLILSLVSGFCLLVLCGLLLNNNQKLNTQYQKIQSQNSHLTTDTSNLDAQLAEKDSYIAGQTDYIAELTTQLAHCQNLLDTSDSKDKNDSDKADASSDQTKYPDLYSQAFFDKKAPQDSLEKVVYLTFDDGPSDLTPKVLDLLDEYHVKATFFVVHTDNPTYTAYLKEIVNRGHTLALHSYSHDYGKIYKSVDAFLADFEQVYNWVYETTGQRATLFRFPGGSTNGSRDTVNSIITEMQRRGFIYYDWNVSSGDGSNLTTSQNIIDNICSNVAAFHEPVVLMHDAAGKNATLNALPSVLKKLSNDGYEFRGLDADMEPVQYRENRK